MFLNSVYFKAWFLFWNTHIYIYRLKGYVDFIYTYIYVYIKYYIILYMYIYIFLIYIYILIHAHQYIVCVHFAERLPLAFTNLTKGLMPLFLLTFLPQS